ncbi:LutC/YkgG family protein [Noviherbaspirillum autotrophicum]|uniref:Lactate utilization protein C n=1 Tax=Noviherbaspirillum autotrophicum TaxID=709839 RepID=A0A0C2BU55_9BURK|nr:lactate utilization protein C [Noviherbaspirillum autotrophicum]KIF81576.1 lactate utilization protein C [Noviherbaspirillum autotrophicum]
MNAREIMLGRLRAAAPKAAAAVDLDRRIDAHFDARRATRSASELAQSLQAAMTASHAEVWQASRSAWPALLAQQLDAHGVRRLLLDTAGAEGAALSQALPPTMQALPFSQPIEAWKSELFDSVDAGFTVARSGIAATGTLVLAPDAGTPRTVSLVPPLHIALVYANTLHADLHAAARAERWRDGMPTNLVLVSGPSKTSDIQQTLAYGAHGPRRMWVIIVTDDATEATP